MILNNRSKTINNDPEKYFTDDIMKQLGREPVKQEFKYGTTILNNCCTPLFLDFKHQITKSRKWNFNYPMGINHLKININKD